MTGPDARPSAPSTDPKTRENAQASEEADIDRYLPLIFHSLIQDAVACVNHLQRRLLVWKLTTTTFGICYLVLVFVFFGWYWPRIARLEQLVETMIQQLEPLEQTQDASD